MPGILAGFDSESETEYSSTDSEERENAKAELDAKLAILNKPEYSEQDYIDKLISREIPSLYMIYKEKRSYRICLEAVKHNLSNFQGVPREHLTPEMCWTAIRINGSVIIDIPEDLQTYEMWVEASKTKLDAMYFPPRKFLTRDLLEIAISRDALVLNVMPLEMLDHQLLGMAVASPTSDFAFKYLHPHVAEHIRQNFFDF